MKKKSVRIVAILLTVASAIALAACNIGGAVNYYGCPNSKRIGRLNTRKKYIKFM